MTHQRSWDIPNEKELEEMSRVIRVSGSLINTVSLWAQAAAIPFLTALLFLSR